VVEPDLFVALSLASAARDRDRPPTSLMGAREMLRDALTRAKTGVEIGPDLAVMQQLIGGSRRALVCADTFAELVAALELAESFQFTPVVVGGREAEKVMNRLATSGIGVVLDTLRADARLAELELPARLAEAGVPFCFGGQADQLRLSAVLAVRHGLDRRTAHAALTRTPAVLLGQQDAIGSLRQGHGADFVVFRGDLLDLGSAHVATWVGGERVWGAAATGATKSTGERPRTVRCRCRGPSSRSPWCSRSTRSRPRPRPTRPPTPTPASSPAAGRSSRPARW
jgi:hypothetical protein